MSGSDARALAIFLMGPTASGKTALACHLATKFPLALVSVDSALVYRGLDIGSGKPDQATLARFPHRLIDIREPAQAYSAAEFRHDALLAMAEITATGRVPLLVGGTGLYFRALQHGLAPLPKADPGVRARLSARAREQGWPTLHAELMQADPAAGRRIEPGDSQRIQRALEVIELSGRPLSELQARATPTRLPYRILKLALVPGDRPEDRAPLHRRIERRFDAMLAAGLLEEVRALRRRGGLDASLPALRAVGYRQVWQHLQGQIDAGEMRLRAIHATRQLAKRQITWLRREADARWLAPQHPGVTARAEQALAAFLI